MFRSRAHTAPPFRLMVALAVVSAATGLALPGQAASTHGDVAAVVISGRGLGHGVGLSQWGAERRAETGESYRRILAFYYPRTQLGRAANRSVRVLLATSPHLLVGSAAPFAIVGADGTRRPLRPGGHGVGLGGIDDIHVPFPLRILPGKAPLRLGGNRYAGTFSVDRVDGALRLVNVVGLEDYVGGVVTSECPGYWHREALRAQAVASRSYVLANLHPDEPFDVYADNRSQNYRGLSRAFPSAIEATASTRHEVLEYGGRIVDAVFSASNGGTTGEGATLIGHPVPYLIPRPDPFDTRSPAAAWGPLRITLSQLRARLPDVPVDVVGVEAVDNAAGRVSQLTFVGENGSIFQTTGFAFQQRLHLRSTYLTLRPEYAPPAR